MKRLSAAFFVIVLLLINTSCGNVHIFEKRPPELVHVFRGEIYAVSDSQSVRAIAEFKADGSAEFLLTEHKTLSGLTFKLSSNSFSVVSGECEIPFDNAESSEKTLFFEIYTALSVSVKKAVEPELLDGVWVYRYPDDGFTLHQDAVSGKILRILFDNKKFSVSFSYGKV